jgi:hypothetical protein
MIRPSVFVCALCGALSSSCSNASSPSPDAGPGGASLAGTWTLNTNPTGTTPILTTVTIAQDSLDITSGDFTLTARRTGNVLTFTDNAPPATTNPGELTASQTAGTFNAGIVPFNLGGSWTMQAGPKGGSPTVSCTLNVTASEIDGSCQNLAQASPWFSFTTQKMNAAASSFGDLGGNWTNTWTNPGTNGGTYPCTLAFTGNSITTCPGGAVNGSITGNPLSGISFTYDGAHTVSGSAQGWDEFSATR